MEIRWMSLDADPLLRIDLEYRAQLQIRMCLIREAEHLMDYLSLVVVELCPKTGTIALGGDTPEPLLSILDGTIGPIHFTNTDPTPIEEGPFGRLFDQNTVNLVVPADL